MDPGDGRERLYYELTNAGGSHDLVTELRSAWVRVSAAPDTAAEAAPAA